MTHIYKGYLINVDDPKDPVLVHFGYGTKYRSDPRIPVQIDYFRKPFQQMKAIVDGLEARRPGDRICLKSRVLSSGAIIVYP